MSRMCSECGKEVPDDMDFCPYCGSNKGFVVMGQNGGFSFTCLSCGASYNPGDAYCGSCGTALPSTDNLRVPMPTMRKNGMAAFLLALIPGLFNVFGLGHLLMRSYARGAMFLVISLVVWYLNDWSIYSSSILLMILEVAVFFYQVMDLSRIVYSPEDK